MAWFKLQTDASIISITTHCTRLQSLEDALSKLLDALDAACLFTSA